MRRPVSSMPIAWRNGIWRCSSVMPPSSGRRPTRASGRPKLASSAATMMSQPSTISKPPPSAWPLTRAITGTSSVSRSAMPPKPPGAFMRPIFEAAARREPPFMSAPAEKARSPAPVSTTTRTSRSASIAAQMRLQLALGRRVDGVQHLGPVDGDARDVVGDGETDRHRQLARRPDARAARSRRAPRRCAGRGRPAECGW